MNLASQKLNGWCGQQAASQHRVCSTSKPSFKTLQAQCSANTADDSISESLFEDTSKLPSMNVIEENLNKYYDLQTDQLAKEKIAEWFSKPPRRARRQASSDLERDVVIDHRLASRQISNHCDEAQATSNSLQEGDQITSEQLLTLSQQRIDNPRKWFDSFDLALLGDRVWEVYIRRVLVLGYDKQQQFQVDGGLARGMHFQAYSLRVLLDKMVLTNEEQSVVRWALGQPLRIAKERRGFARSIRQSNALEALVGYLYMQNPPRLHELMDEIGLKDFQSVQDMAADLQEDHRVDSRIFEDSIGSLPLGQYAVVQEEEWEEQAEKISARYKQRFGWLKRTAKGPKTLQGEIEFSR